MLGDLLAAIFGLIKKGDYKRASENLGKIYYDMLKEDASYFGAIPANELTHKLLKEHDYTNGHLEILAELFNAEAELEFAKGEKNISLEYYRKSLLLFDFIDHEQRTMYPERLGKMEAIRKRIEEIRLG